MRETRRPPAAVGRAWGVGPGEVRRRGAQRLRRLLTPELLRLCFCCLLCFLAVVLPQHHRPLDPYVGPAFRAEWFFSSGPAATSCSALCPAHLPPLPNLSPPPQAMPRLLGSLGAFISGSRYKKIRPSPHSFFFCFAPLSKRNFLQMSMQPYSVVMFCQICIVFVIRSRVIPKDMVL